MAGKSTSERYGTVAVIIHWVSAALIVVALISGFRAEDAANSAAKITALQKHVPATLTILLLTVLRLIWWWKFDVKPRPVGKPGAWDTVGAKAVHIAFYVVIVGMLASGIGMMIASGAMPTIFSGDSANLPDFNDFRPRVPHGIGAKLLVALLIAHVGAALYHHFVRRDAVLRRMWFGRSEA